MATRRDAELRRGVGLGLLASVIFVNLAMAVFVSLGVVAASALGVTPAVFVIAGAVFLLTMLGYIEGIAMLPQAGGAAGFTRHGLGELTSFFAGWALILDYLILVVLTAYFAVHYAGSIPGLGSLLQAPTDTVASGCFIIAVAVLALRGVRAGTRAAVMISLVALAAQVLLALLGLALVFDPTAISAPLDLGTSPTWEGVLFALPLAMIGFTGLDSVANLGGELQKPGRDVPRPMIWSAVVSVLVFVLMSVVALSALPVSGQGAEAATPLGLEHGWVDRPLIGIVEGLSLSAAANDAARALFGLLAAAVLFLAASTALAALGRVAWYMGRHRQAPSALTRIDRRTGVPRLAIALLTLVALALLGAAVSIAESALALVQVYAFGATLTATLAGLAMIRMRWCERDLERPFVAPGNVTIRGARVSLLMLAGTAGSLTMWLLVLTTHDTARFVGLVWMVFGFVGYGAYRLTHGLPLARRADPHVLPAPQIDASSYRRVLIAVRPERGMLYGGGDAELVGLANKLIERGEGERGEIAVMLVHELPLVEPLDAPLGEAEAQTTSRLAQIRRVAERLDLRVLSTVTRARAAGRAICQEADRRGADAVLLGTRMKRRKGDEVFGRSVTYVLRHAPCDVLVLALPEESLRRGRWAAADAAAGDGSGRVSSSR